jgi:hypothetical protein
MDEYTSGTISITKIQDSGTTFNDNDTSLMTAAAIADKIEAYGYSTTAGDITGVTAGTGLSGGGASGAVTLNVDAAQTQITSVGTIGTGVWQGTAINQTYLNGQSGTNTGDETRSSIEGLGITVVGTVSEGTWEGTAIASAYLDSDTAHLSGTQTFTGAKTFSNDTTTFTSANADDPAVIIQNTTNDDQAARLQFVKNRGVDGVDGDNVGEIEFWSYDDGTPSTQMYGKIYTEIHDATNGQESGRLELLVASHDGGNNSGLRLTGGSEDNEVDVEIGRGAASVTDIQGTLSMGGHPAMTNAGLLSVANQSSITGLGTITSGVWNGTAIGGNYIAATQPNIESIGTDGDTLAILSDQLLMSNTSSDSPVIKLLNTTDDSSQSEIIFEKLRDDDAVTSGQNLGAIWFRGQDASQNTEDYAYIIGEIDVSTGGQESGQLVLGVANHDGGNGTGLKLTGGSEDNEIDITVGLGANSVVTIPGNIDLAGDIDVDGTLETDALTIGGAAVLAQATASAVGAVELATDAEAVTATDTTRAVTPANLKARVSQIINLKGYATLQDDVYDFANPFATDDEAPFQLDESYGSGTISSGTEVTQGKFFRAGGFHVPFACTVSAIQSQITCNNAGNVSVALVEYRPSDAGSDQSDYPRTVYETIVNASDDSNNKVDTVSINADDLDETAVPAGSHLMIMVKGDGTSVGGTLVVSVAVGLSW